MYFWVVWHCSFVFRALFGTIVGEVWVIVDTFRTLYLCCFIMILLLVNTYNMLIESQLAALRFLKYQGQVLTKTKISVQK